MSDPGPLDVPRFLIRMFFVLLALFAVLAVCNYSGAFGTP
jgi:phage shock protein PspC (stress-responsive transcriptional regulator)